MDKDREEAFLQLLTRATEKLGEVDFLLFQLLNERYFDRHFSILTERVERMANKSVSWSSSVFEKVSKIHEDMKKRQAEREKDREECAKRHQESLKKDSERRKRRFPPPESWFTENERENNP